MTTSTRDLADRAQTIQAASEGLAKVAAGCVAAMCASSPSVAVARGMLEQLDRPDLRNAAVALLDQLAAAAAPVN